MLQTLPRELITLIFTFLTEQDLGRVARVCRYFSSLLATFDKIVWKEVYYRRTKTLETNCPHSNSSWKTKLQFYVQVEENFLHLKPTSVESLGLHLERTSSLQYDNTNKILVSGGRDGLVKVTQMDSSKFQTRSIFRGHNGPVFCIQYDANLKKIVSAGEDGIVRLWKVDREFDEAVPLVGHTGPITRAQFDTEKIASCSDDYTINIWDLQTASLRDTLKEHTDEVWAMYFEGNVLLSGSNDKLIKVWDLRTKKSTKSLSLTEGQVRHVYFSGDMMICSSFGEFLSYDLRMGRKLFSMQVSGWINHCRFDSFKIVGASQNAELYIFDKQSGSLVTHQRLDSFKSLISFHMDSSNLILAGQCPVVKFYHFGP